MVRDDERMELHIVPFTLAQFSTFFKSIFSKGTATPQTVVDLMVVCEALRHGCEAPAWNAISQAVATYCNIQ